MKFSLLLSIIWGLMLAAMSLEAAEIKRLDTINITSISAVFSPKNKNAIFKGHVEADDGAAKLTCEQMEVFMDEKQQPKRIICEEMVIIRHEQSISTSDRAEYEVEKEKFKSFISK